MSLFTFSKASTTTFAPTRGRNRPVQPEFRVNDVVEQTEAMTNRISNYGVDLIHHFVIEDLPIADYQGGWDWAAKTQAPGTMSLVGHFFTVGNRMRDQFTFNDEASVAHTTRYYNANFKPVDPDNRYVNISFDLIEENYA